jgi:AraC-like DNA-binding protein
MSNQTKERPAAAANEPDRDADDRRRCDAATAFMQEHFRRAPGLAEIARASGWSAFHFHRRYRELTGRTPKAVLTGLQIDLAKLLMLNGMAMAEVAVQCGFAHQSHFTSRFKQAVGATPGSWIRQSQRDAAA